MTARRAPRLTISRDDTPFTERALHELGAHPAFVDAILGDMTEERARRESESGTVAARIWYAREALRAVPHLLLNAIRHGGSEGRARAATVLGAIALLPAAAFLALLLRNGPPARLVIGTGNADGTLIVNSLRPIRLSMKAFDERGHAWKAVGVQYKWASGVPVTVTPNGVITCTQPGDATVRASLDDVTTSVLLRCRPVSGVYAPPMMNIVVGGPPQDLSFVALDPDGHSVTQLAGEIVVRDSTIATVERGRIRALAPGSTSVSARFGDKSSFTSVHVYGLTRSLENIRPDQHVAVPVQLGGGEMRRWRLPASPEPYYVAMLPDRADQPTPLLRIVGPTCEPAPYAHSFFCLAQSDASIFVYHPRSVDPGQTLSGTLLVWRQTSP